MSANGTITLMAQARFETLIIGSNGQRVTTGGPGPFADRWPTLRITAQTSVPAGYALTLRQNGPRVTIIAPPEARSRLSYLYLVTCQDSAGMGRTEGISLVWQPLAGTEMSEPACPGTQVTWTYAVGAPGYAIASGVYRAP